MTNWKDFNFEYSDVYEPKEQPTLFPGMCENHDCELLQCLLNLPLLQEESNTLTMQNIRNHQNLDHGLRTATRNELSTTY